MSINDKDRAFSVPLIFKLPTKCVFGYVWDKAKGCYVPCQLPYGHKGDCDLLPKHDG